MPAGHSTPALIRAESVNEVRDAVLEHARQYSEDFVAMVEADDLEDARALAVRLEAAFGALHDLGWTVPPERVGRFTRPG